MSEPSVVRLGGQSPNGEDYLPAPEKIISGDPRQCASIEYSDPNGKFVTGLWRCEPGKWRVSYDEEEYCRLLAGVCVITDAREQSVTLRAGDEFVMPRGFLGTWEVLEVAIKRFVIYEPGSESTLPAKSD